MRVRDLLELVRGGLQRNLRRTLLTMVGSSSAPPQWLR